MKKKLLIAFLPVFVLIIIFSVLFARNYGKACDTYASEGVRGKLTALMNDTVTDKLKSSESSYGDFAQIGYRDDGTVSCIIIDSVRASVLASELSNEIYYAVENEKPEFGIPFGNTLGFRSLSGKGAEIPVTVVPVGAVAYEIKSEFVSGGLNQTLHRIIIRFSVTVSCLTPFHESVSVITSEICVAETVIVGTVPGILWSR